MGSSRWFPSSSWPRPPYWRWMVTAAGLVALFVVFTPIFHSDVLLAKRQDETNTTTQIDPEWITPFQMSVAFLGAPVAAQVSRCFRLTNVILIAAVTLSGTLLTATVVRSEFFFHLIMLFIYPLSASLILHAVTYVLSTHYKKREFVQSLAMATLGLPFGALLSEFLKPVLNNSWRTHLQVTAGVSLVLMLPSAMLTVPSNRRQIPAPPQRGRPRHSSVVSGASDGAYGGRGSSKLTSIRSPTSLSSQGLSGSRNLLSEKVMMKNCEVSLLFAWVVLPHLAWFADWFGMVSVWGDIERAGLEASLLRQVMTYSEIVGKVVLMIIAGRINLHSTKVSCFVVQFVLYIVVSLLQLTIPHKWSFILTAIVGGVLRGTIPVVAFALLNYLGGPANQRRSATLTMVAIGIGYLCGLAITGAVHLTTNALRHVFFLNVVVYQLALLVIVAAPLKSSTEQSCRVENQDSLSTDGIQMSVCREDADPSTDSRRRESIDAGQ